MANKETEPKSGWWRKLLTVPGVIATTVLTALVGAGVTWTINHLQEVNFRPSDAVKLSVETDPDKIMGGAYEVSRAAIIPSDVRTHGAPGPGCTGFHSWFVDNHGADAHETVLQITAQNPTDKPVYIQNIHVSVDDTSPPLTGIFVSCPVGGLVEPRPIAVDLDATPQHAIDYHPDCRRAQGCSPDGSDAKSPVGFTLKQGDTESFIVSATAAKATYRWRL